VVSSGGLLGVGDTLNAVPPNALRYSSDGDSLQINLSKEELARMPVFKKTEWPNFNDPTYSGKVYRSYGVEPYFSTDADNTSRNVRDRSDTTLTPLDQGSTEGDVLITRRIRQEILARDGFSASARNVKVITVNGRVTLRGPVNGEAEKEAIAAIATRLAANGNVDNQLEVKREP
jgi:hyperosmotically inducible protein